MTLGAGLVLSGCGDDDTATTPAPAPPPPPPPAPEPEPEPEPPPAPEPPATPTGLHVDETTETSIEWHWNAVEGASAYVVQYSMNEMFGDEDDVTDITLENHYAVTELEPDTTVYLRVAAAVGTSLEDAVHSAFTTHVTGMSNQPPPPPPPPMAPATPTGFMVESDMTSITWSWDAVEGALGYAIQVSEDEMFDDMDHLGLTLETSHTVSPLPPGTTLFARVASGTGTPEAIAAAVATGSLEGLLVSAWTTHMTGMTMVPPPPPPPTPDPVEVTFTPPEGKYPMVPDDEVRKDTAEASVNPKMTVSSNATAVIIPMFVEDAAGVAVTASDDNMPFAYVEWSMLQADVVASGATFMVQRTAMGANQEMEPTGDVAYVTCGPFECVDGMEAPGYSADSSAVCAAWDPEVELQVGLIDNDVFAFNTYDTATPPVATRQTSQFVEVVGATAITDGPLANEQSGTGVSETWNDGIDIGWVIASNTAMTVKHVFSGVANGDNYTVPGPSAAKSSSGAALTVNKRDPSNSDATASDDILNENEQYTPGILVDRQQLLRPEVSANFTQDGADDDDTFVVCEETSTYGDTIGANHRPDTCFRLIARMEQRTSNGRDITVPVNYLEGYGIELQPVNPGVGWGEIAWDEFEDLECDSMTFMATEVMDMDICDMFEAEVDGALAKGWGGRHGTVNHAVADGLLSNWNVEASPGKGGKDRFKTVWFDDDLDGKIRKLASDTQPGPGGPNDLYEDNTDGTTVDGNITTVWRSVHDADSDPRWGDLGKVDLAGSDRDGDAPGNDKMNPDGKADNYGADAKACSDADGDGCDAEWSETYDVLFADGVFGCTTERSLTITCEWDAQGELGKYTRKDHDAKLDGADAAQPSTSSADTEDDVLAEDYNGLVLTGTASTTNLRTPGHISAFIKCVAN